MEKGHLDTDSMMFLIQFQAIGNVYWIIDEIKVSQYGSFGLQTNLLSIKIVFLLTLAVILLRIYSHIKVSYSTSCSRRKLYVTRVVRLEYVQIII